MKSTALFFWLILALAASGSYAGWFVFHNGREKSATTGADDTSAAGQPDFSRSNIPAGGPTVPGFKLINQSGKEFDSKKLLGSVWVGSYFFASCPGPCYKLNQALAGLQAESDLDDVKFVSITCDPSNDTPEALRTYADRFAANPKRWEFLTGDEKEVLRIGQADFCVQVAPKTHSELAVVFDRQSRIRGYFDLTDAVDVNRLHKRLRELLAEKDSGASPITK